MTASAPRDGGTRPPDARQRTIADRRPWLRFALGLVLLASAAWIWVSSAGVLLSDHPAYAVLVTAAAVVGTLLLLSATSTWRRVRPPRAAWRRALAGTCAVLATLAVVGSLLWLRPFSAAPVALDAMSGTADVRVTSSTTVITLLPTGVAPRAGLVFQPGARVDARAYVPLLTRVSRAGYLVVIVKQPLDIAFTAIDAPSGIIDDHPEISAWAVGGHSLGGVAASSYAAAHPEEVGGLLLWASYPPDSLADRDDLRAASVSGTLDGLATPDDLAASRADLPPDTAITQVEGGIHAFFGDYGDQPGDGTPTVSRAAAQDQVVGASIALLDSLGSGR
ncbi:alpha/beta hydrolase [Agrococcus citreus]|uniref:Alpha/beta hydrolase fold-5 domain-containing protein n=1 Tax=Agrococcus citreus TaxID=84643 RepID=A0ABN1YXD1_9MICO